MITLVDIMYLVMWRGISKSLKPGFGHSPVKSGD